MNNAYRQQRRRPRRGERRGVTVIIVLGLISIALALSYSILRAQGTALRVQQNSAHRQRAKQAALTGLSVGLGRMHSPDWQGVETELTGELGEGGGFSVRFATGDPGLVRGTPEFDAWPYRVTIESTGRSADEEDNGVVSTHVVQAVVELVPRALSAEPDGWAAMMEHTVYQRSDAPFQCQFPAQIEGAVWVQGVMGVCREYPRHATARLRYLDDLRRMKDAGRPDYRPLTGPVRLRPARQLAETGNLLNATLGVTTQTISAHTAALDLREPHETYQLFPGGQVYDVPTVASPLENVRLAADPQTNPLGMFYRSREVLLMNNVSIQGTLITGIDVQIYGDNVTLAPVLLPPLAGTETPIRLPAAIAADDFRVQDAASGSVQGVIAVHDEFEIKEGHGDVAFDLQGRLIARGFYQRGRYGWDYSESTWGMFYSMFMFQLGSAAPVTQYFPEFMQIAGRNPRPLLTLRPPMAEVVEHWKRPDEPVYVPHAPDAGLRWTLVRWTDNP